MSRDEVILAGEGCNFDYPELFTLFLHHSNTSGFGMGQTPATGWVFQKLKDVTANRDAGTDCSCNSRHWLGHLVLCLEWKSQQVERCAQL